MGVVAAGFALGEQEEMAAEKEENVVAVVGEKRMEE